METQTWEIDMGTSSHREIVKHNDGDIENISVTCQNLSPQSQNKNGNAKVHSSKSLNKQKGDGYIDKKKKSKSTTGDKTKLCDFYKKSGECKFQEKCLFSHNRNTKLPSGEALDNPQKISDSKTDELHGKDSFSENRSTDRLSTQLSDDYLNINSSNDKTCQFFSTQSGCRFGDRCSFTHYRSVGNAASDETDPVENITLSTQINPRACVFFKKSRGCSKGDQCDFTHELKDDVLEMDMNKESLDGAMKDSMASNPKTAKPCRFFLMSRGCRLKEKCPFLHIAKKMSSSMSENWRKNSGDGPREGIEEGNIDSDILEDNGVKFSNEFSSLDNPQATCRFFLSPKGCFRGAKCTFIHPENNEVQKTDSSTALQEREFKQLEKRFSADGKCTLIQSNGSKIYSVIFEPSDPDWGIVVKEFELVVEFPQDYPNQMFSITLKDKEIYPERFTNFMNYGIQEWIKGREQERDANDLAFRPFLKWFDRHAEELVLEAGRKVKQLRDAQDCGITLIPHDNIIQNDSAPESSNDEMDDEDVGEENEDADQHDEVEMNRMSFGSNQANDHSVEKLSSKVKTGTEVKFTHLEMSENVATLQLRNALVVVQCGRCKTKKDFNLVAKKKSTSPCKKCHVNHTATLHPEIVHQYSHVAGYLHLDGCKVFDVVLIDSNIVINCLSCAKDHIKKGLTYGKKSDHWCQHCHAKMEIQIMTTKFTQLQKNGEKFVEVKVGAKKPVKYPGIKEGTPLPEKGACKHYKKSYRWLRFPCCGKVYPCDICHEEGEENDHEMKFATRMICGYCSKEQAFAKEKPCVSCKASLTKSKSSHWEGGKGCRNKVNMSRSDNKKTAGLGKTISRKKADS